MSRSSGLVRWILLAAILLVALGLRLGWGLSRPTDDDSLKALPDQLEYLQLGRNLMFGDYVMYDARFKEELRAFRPPGYPMLINLCRGDLQAIRVTQAFIDTLTVLAVFLLARRWLTERASLIAAGLAALNPLFVYFSALILTETLFAALLAWGLVLITSPRLTLMLPGMLVMAAMVLVRSSAIALPVLAASVAAVAVPRQGRFAVAAASAVAVVLVLGGWVIRNYQETGRIIWSSTSAGQSLYDGLNPDATGASDLRVLDHVAGLSQLDEFERDAYLRRQAREHVLSHPEQVLKLAPVKLGRTWSPIPLSEQFGSSWLYVTVGLIGSGGLMLLTVVGLFSKLSQSAKVLLLAPALYFSLIHMVGVGSLRYRVPAEAPMAVVAAACFGVRRGTALPDGKDAPQ